MEKGFELQKKIKISTSIFRLVTLNVVICTTSFLSLNYFGDFKIDLAYLLLSSFACFITGFLILYYFYYVNITNNMNALADKIKKRFLNNEIPQKYNQLEEQDGMSLLEERVDFLIESREKEVFHFENLDSYRKEYLGNVSHELKTPVFNIQGYIDTLLNGGLEDSNINVDYLKRAEKSIDRLISIIDDLETITQLESGGLDLDIDTFDMAHLCKDVYASLELNAAKRNIKLELARKYDKPILVKADKFRIRQVLVNLITNSVKYGKENGTTLIELNYLNDDVVVEISDNGNGIDEKHLPRIFERFYRIDKGRSREQGGTGLGLAIVKHIIEAHDKSIKVESQEGKGTKFTFSLPADQ
ncbi:sensor histidine kinase [Aurantibacillus circumpalustris]|uniref:sensor histidine kinase n=1 Tax=Aurantibacillus circumpalustris TaxID=3036359 RepID=UPI00295A861B|nr:ATP-binding protein [Aurantibacillus circumpalustris]